MVTALAGRSEAPLVSRPRDTLSGVRVASSSSRASLPLAPGHSVSRHAVRTEPLDTDEGWAKFNRHYWPETTAASVEFSSAVRDRAAFDETGSRTRVGWGWRPTPRRCSPLLQTGFSTRRAIARSLRAGAVPGARDPRRRGTRSAARARGVGSRTTTGGARPIEGSGHCSCTRDPVQDEPPAPRLLAPPAAAAALGRGGKSRRKRALFISSPIGLGHAQRDVAIADELRQLHPDLRDRLAGAASGHAGARERRASGSTRRAHCSRTSRATSSASPPSTTCTASRRSGAWTRS